MVLHPALHGKRIRCYGSKEVVLSYSTYLRNGRICLRLMGVKEGRETAPVAVCTVNLPQVPMAPDEVAVKTWHENVGMLGWLMEEGIVSEPQRYAFFAGVFIPVCSLLLRQDNKL